jgi:hypothetical protein
MALQPIRVLDPGESLSDSFSRSPYERWVGGITTVPVRLAMDVHRIMKAGQAS